MDKGSIAVLRRSNDRMEAVDRIEEANKEEEEEEEEEESVNAQQESHAVWDRNQEQNWEKMLCSGLRELGIREEQERCITHRGNVMDWYCEGHELACCGTCVIQSHGRCKEAELLIYIPDKTKGIHKSIEYFEILSTLKSSIDKLNHLRDLYQNDKCLVTEEKEKALAAKNAFRQRLEELLDDMDITTERKLREKHKAIQADIDVAIERIDGSIDNLEGIVRMIEMKEGNNEFKTFLHMETGKKVNSDADALLKMPKEREEITCVTYPSIEGTLRAFGGYWGLVPSTPTHECDTLDKVELCDTVLETQNGELVEEVQPESGTYFLYTLLKKGVFLPNEGLNSQIPSSVITFDPLTGQDTRIKNGVQENVTTRLQCITAMKEYENTSFEELRTEEYTAAIEGVRIFESPTSAQSSKIKDGSTKPTTPETSETPAFSLSQDAQSQPTSPTETCEISVTSVSTAASETERTTSTTQVADTMSDQAKPVTSTAFGTPAVTQPPSNVNDRDKHMVQERYGTQTTDIPTEEAKPNTTEVVKQCTITTFPDTPFEETLVATEVGEHATTTELQDISSGEAEPLASEAGEHATTTPYTGTASKPEIHETRNITQHTDISHELTKALSSQVDEDSPTPLSSDQNLKSVKPIVSQSYAPLSTSASSDQSTSEPIKVTETATASQILGFNPQQVGI